MKSWYFFQRMRPEELSECHILSVFHDWQNSDIRYYTGSIKWLHIFHLKNQQKHFCRQENFLVRSFPYAKYFCERKKENNRDNPSTFQCTITFSGRHIFSRTFMFSCVSWFTWQMSEFVEIEIGLHVHFICYVAIKNKFWIAIFSTISSLEI